MHTAAKMACRSMQCLEMNRRHYRHRRRHELEKVLSAVSGIVVQSSVNNDGKSNVGPIY